MLTTAASYTLSFTLLAPGIEAVNSGDLRVGDLIRKNMGDGTQLWKIVAIDDDTCYLEVPTIWDDMFADLIGW